MSRIEPIASRVFSEPEIWLILRKLGALELEAAPPTDTDTSEDLLPNAERSLTITRGFQD